MTAYGLMKQSSRYLHKVIHQDEHIEAVAYGRYEGGSGLLVGTDSRIIFLDHKLGLTTCDELSFDIISGVKSWYSGPLASLTLHTKLGDYQLRYVNPVCVKNFVRYAEARRIEGPGFPVPASDTLFQAAIAMEPDTKAFLLAHDVAVLSSVDRRGNVHGATVYYLARTYDHIYILTRSETAKTRDILAHTQVALTISDEDPPRTLQLQGVAQLENDPKTRDEVFSLMIQPRLYKNGLTPPPVSKYRAGGYAVIRITPTSAVYRPFNKEKGYEAN